MYRNIVFIICSFLFSGEMEVDGNLKVTGNIDASGQPINNVGVPLSMTDAINGNVLKDALRDDGVYEYKIYLTRLIQDRDTQNIYYYEYQQGATPQNNYDEWSSYFHNILFSLILDGWEIDRVIESTNPTNDNYYFKNLYIFKRPIEE